MQKSEFWRLIDARLHPYFGSKMTLKLESTWKQKKYIWIYEYFITGNKLNGLNNKDGTANREIMMFVFQENMKKSAWIVLTLYLLRSPKYCFPTLVMTPKSTLNLISESFYALLYCVCEEERLWVLCILYIFFVLCM